MPHDQIFDRFGETTFDIYLNDVAFWRNVPARVWEYTLSGYQVLKKWLSYREEPLLGRSLTIDEVQEVQDIARRIALMGDPALPIDEICRTLGVSRATLYRHVGPDGEIRSAPSRSTRKSR